MAAEDITCPRCGSDDHLRGEQLEALIRITCTACDLVWDRDPTPSCPRCGRTDVTAVPQAIVDKARGTQLSVMGFRVVHLCPACDADALAAQRQTNTPLAPRENPAQGMR